MSVENKTNLCISDAEVLMPRQNSSITPVTATHNRNLVLVKKVHTALVGGKLALATFQLIPPFGSNIFKQSGWPATPPKKGLAAGHLRPSSGQGVSRCVAVRPGRRWFRRVGFSGGESSTADGWAVWNCVGGTSPGRGSLADCR